MKRNKNEREDKLNSDVANTIKILLMKVSKLEADMAWVKKLIYSILAILLSLLAKTLLGG